MHDIGSFEVRFWHDREAEVTVAQIKDKITEAVVEAAVARHANDKFEFKKARKFALTKALKPWGRGIRKGFWHEYKAARPQDVC